MVEATGTPRIGPLRDLRVLDLSRHFPGARSTLLFADLGADVIKVESPSGDSVRGVGRTSWVNESTNRGKRSIVLNLKSPEAADVLRRLASTADVLIESARPGSMEKMGLGFADLAKLNPGLVWCSITSFGDGSPRADEAGHELNFFGYTGILDTIYPEPRQTGAPFGLNTTMGGVMATLGILAALRERDRTGVGSRVDTSIVDSAAWLMADLVVGHDFGVKSLPHHVAYISTYTCADGKMITLSASEPSTWNALTQTLGLTDLKWPVTEQENTDVRATLRDIFASKPSTEWLALLSPARASVGPVNSIADMFTDPHFVEREMFVQRGGRRVFANPIRIHGADGPQTATAQGGAPDVGEQTTEILAEAGYSPEEIDGLRTAGAI